VRLFSLALPWLVLAVESVGFAGYAAINVTLLHRDLGIGDGFSAPLPNGYEMEAIDVTDRGWILDPVAAKDEEGINNTAHSIGPVRQFQIDGEAISGMAQEDPMAGQSPNAPQYFVIDTSTAQRWIAPSQKAWVSELNRRGLMPHLSSFDDQYAKHRFGWFDWLAYGIGACVPVLAAALWIWLIVLARRRVTQIDGDAAALG
jgi:hypothetical protein